MSLWPLITVIIYHIDQKSDVSVFESYIQFIILIFCIPALLGAGGTGVQIVAILLLIYFFKVFPDDDENEHEE